MILRLNASQLSKMDTCGRAYRYYYRDQLVSKIRSISLIFGDCIHQAITGWIESTVLDREPIDPQKIFSEVFSSQVRSLTVSYPDKWTEADFRATGKMLIERFQAYWIESGYTPILREEGVWIERPLAANFGPRGIIEGFPAVQIELYGTPDILVTDRNGRPILLDFKTTASEYPEIYLDNSDQLKVYQILAAANSDLLGFDQIEGTGFIELVRRKVPVGAGQGPTIVAPPLSAPADEDAIAEFQQKILWTAEDILRERFPKKSHSAFNTPCGMCEYALACTRGDERDLVSREQQAKPSKALALAA